MKLSKRLRRWRDNLTTQASVEYVLALRRDVSIFADEAKALERDNAKLRNLVEDMLDCIEIRAAWHRPPTEEMCEEFAKRARGLGIEVE